jgi:uncharacterized repeat protein (TIGR01451 family)
MKVGKFLILTMAIGLLAAGSVWAGAPKQVLLGNFDNGQVSKPAPNTAHVQALNPVSPRVHINSVRTTSPTPPPATRGAVNLTLDDGTVDNAYGYGTWGRMFWFNRFTPAASDFPFVLDAVDIYFWSSSVFPVGSAVHIVVIDNLTTTDPTGPGTDGTFVVQYDTTVGSLDAFNHYVLPAPPTLTGPGDVCIGVWTDIASSGIWPAAVDETAGQGRSYFGDYSVNCATGPYGPPSPFVWPPNCGAYTLEEASLSPGNWMVRGIGHNNNPELVLDHSTFIDSCVNGGPGDGDGFIDPGETIDYTVYIRNAGLTDATDVVATLTSAFPGMTITSNTIGPFNIPIGGTASGTFTFEMPLAGYCGQLIPMTTTTILTQAPGVFVLNEDLRVGDWTAGPVVELLNEPFEVWPLAGWTIENLGTNGAGWESFVLGGCYAPTDPNPTGGAGDCAIVASDCYGASDSTISNMISPAFAIPGTVSVATLQFKQYYLHLGSQVAAVDIWNGATWVNLVTYSASVPAGTTTNLDLSAYKGISGLKVRFRYSTLDWDWYWLVDDVIVTTQTNPCTMNTCMPAFSVNILTPIDGRDLYQITEVCAQVTDPAIVSHVNWYIDGVAIPGCQGLTWPPDAAYCCTFDPQMYSWGAHTLRAEAVLLTLDSVWSAPVTFYVVGPIKAFPDVWPPAGLVPLNATFIANVVWGSGQYQLDWWVSGLGLPGTPGGSGSVVPYTFNAAGDYLVTLIATDTKGTLDDTDDTVIFLPPIKVTAVQLATPINPASRRNTAMVGSL